MNSPTRMTIPNNSLAVQLQQIGLCVVPAELDDFLARATKQRWSPRQIFEQLAQAEAAERAGRSLERRPRLSGIKSFKPMADFDWAWPTKIERDVIERALTPDFLAEARRRKLRTYANVGLLCIDEVGYLSFDDKAADLLYEAINRRYERKSIIITTNRPFKERSFPTPPVSSPCWTVWRLRWSSRAVARSERPPRWAATTASYRAFLRSLRSWLSLWCRFNWTGAGQGRTVVLAAAVLPPSPLRGSVSGSVVDWLDAWPSDSAVGSWRKAPARRSSSLWRV